MNRHASNFFVPPRELIGLWSEVRKEDTVEDLWNAYMQILKDRGMAELKDLRDDLSKEFELQTTDEESAYIVAHTPDVDIGDAAEAFFSLEEYRRIRRAIWIRLQVIDAVLSQYQRGKVNDFASLRDQEKSDLGSRMAQEEATDALELQTTHEESAHTPKVDTPDVDIDDFASLPDQEKSDLGSRIAQGPVCERQDTARLADALERRLKDGPTATAQG